MKKAFIPCPSSKVAQHVGMFHRLQAVQLRLEEARSGQSEWLTTRELARRLGITTKTLANKKAKGIFRSGEHYAEPPGMTVRWRWSAFIRDLERGHQLPSPKPLGLAFGDGIARARRR